MDFRSLLGLALIPVEYLRDTLRSFRWSKSSPFCPKQKQLYYDIILLAHTVEKGLSVSEPRPGFGKEKISTLLLYLSKYRPEWDVFCVEKSYGCLSEYIEWHDSIGFDLGERYLNIKKFLDHCDSVGVVKRGGTENISMSSLSSKEMNFEESLLCRHSSRQYLSQKVEEDTLDKIGRMVTRTPSQCNRQSARVHYYSNYNTIQNLLSLQGGAEGFKEGVYNLFVVSSELSAWSGFKARSQAYVDASLLAMQLMNAVQSQGLGYCPLNLAVSNRREKEICIAGSISQGERLVMMISFGYPLEGDFKVAKSARIKPESLIIQH